MILFETIPEAQSIELRALNRAHERSVLGFAATGAASMPFLIGATLPLEALGIQDGWSLLAILIPLGAMAGFMLRGKHIERRLMEIERRYSDAVL